MWYESRRDPQIMRNTNEFDQHLRNACEKLPKPAQEKIQRTYEQVQEILADYLLLMIFLAKVYRAFHLRKPQNHSSDYDKMRVVMHEAAVVESEEKKLSEGKKLCDSKPILVG
jgi:hypothetical protein